jgi:hypothetical protein
MSWYIDMIVAVSIGVAVSFLSAIFLGVFIFFEDRLSLYVSAGISPIFRRKLVFRTFYLILYLAALIPICFLPDSWSGVPHSNLNPFFNHRVFGIDAGLVLGSSVTMIIFVSALSRRRGPRRKS